jgi:hypothetical protein
MAERVNVSIRKDQQEFLNSNPNLSPSKILQTALEQLIREYHLGNDIDKDFVLELRKARENWQNLFYKAQEFIREKGFEKEFAERLL